MALARIGIGSALLWQPYHHGVDSRPGSSRCWDLSMSSNRNRPEFTLVHERRCYHSLQYSPARCSLVLCRYCVIFAAGPDTDTPSRYYRRCIGTHRGRRDRRLVRAGKFIRKPERGFDRVFQVDVSIEFQ